MNWDTAPQEIEDLWKQVAALKARLATLDTIAIEDSAEVCAELRKHADALLAGRELMSERIRKLREYIASNCPHAALDSNCPTCEFLREDAK